MLSYSSIYAKYWSGPFHNFQHKSRSEIHERRVVTGRQNTREKDWMNLICLITFQTTFKCGLNLICKKNIARVLSVNFLKRLTVWTTAWEQQTLNTVSGLDSHSLSCLKEKHSLLCHGCWLRWSTGLIPKNVVLISHFKPKYINWSPRFKHTRCTLYLFHTETGSGTISGPD